MGMVLSPAQRAKLKGVHPDLVKVVNRLCEVVPIDYRFTILETVRTAAVQKRNVARGVSQTMKSRHIPSQNKSGLCCAVDIAPLIGGKVSWAWPAYYILAPMVKQAAKDVGVPIEWGGDWKSFKDGPHWQLPWKQYP